MTTTEFSNEFDIVYNSIATNNAPGIDLYEKSVYLTRAQLELVKDYFNPLGNKYKTGFESSSKRRNDLNELIKSFSNSTELISNNGISNLSKFFTIPNETFLIVQEDCKLSSSNSCINGLITNVVPKTHDEFNRQINNPFKKPNEKVVWRMDIASQSGGNKNIELISEYDIDTYNNRYIIYPEPIILTNLATAYPSESLSIDGITIEQTSKLSESIHREIIDRAAELAFVDYKQRNAQLKIQTDIRNE